MREMKDSGVEWIGEIPKDWEIVPLTKQLDSIIDYRGKTPEKTEEGTFLVTAKNIKDGKICYELSKVLLEYYKLEKDFEGSIELESTEGGYTPISGDSGHREPKKDPLTVIIDKINEKYGTHFTEMDKVLVQMENDYANQEKWQSYAKNNDRATFMLLFEKDFPNMAADRYEQNDQFFRKLFDDPDMMKQVMETVGSVLYERLKKKYIFDPKSGVIEEATPETYVEDTYLTKK